ncbi:MAG: DNA gyrase inhibitor YacG [Rhodospirillaceae bacterium]|nr:DNA gyrase inhibitor YacG [Rhodospirillaceae bacterium]
MCGKIATHKFRPFCSKNCSNLDLSRWFRGQYRVETEERPGLDDFPESLIPRGKENFH